MKKNPPNSDIRNTATQFDPLVFSRNMAEAIGRTQQIAQNNMLNQTNQAMHSSADPMNMHNAWVQYMEQLLSDPDSIIKRQQENAQSLMDLWQYSARRMLGDKTVTPPTPAPKDRRFRSEAWQDDGLFEVIQQSYWWMTQTMQGWAQASETLDNKSAQKINFYTQQISQALSPSNFLMTNPEALEATLQSNGENLLAGLSNLEQDLAAGRMRMTDESAFTVGKNLAATPGYVVHKNALMELIQYSPTTDDVQEVPLLLIPAWINKYYILDLGEKNSMIAWLVSQGYTVFVISWVNPDASHKNCNFDDYMQHGPLAALDVIKERTACETAHVAGYCLGGTLLAMTLAWMHAKGQQSRIKSATYLTTMVDFAEAGDLGVFIDEAQLDNLAAKLEKAGYLDGADMAMTFNLLRPNDLIWSFVVNNYLLGKTPFPFDLLYWNSDCTRMPAAMHTDYMRHMYLHNDLVKKGGISIGGEPVDLTTITTPSFILSTREDHIAPWQSTYKATSIYQGPVEFVLAESGHVAGVISSPSKPKYGYWKQSKNGALPKDSAVWLEHAKQKQESWWLHWDAWLRKQHGGTVKARRFSAKEAKNLTPAPGDYVLVR